ncbi:helix-turn-helix domain-containing protein [Hydrogenovibrio sp. 3SP14C1]|uniref:helix-turn-helix domain-containing protein n=1 Tax=Hydrogenovibrio sp. 3SP14C1 TaxID=3038774 RepID=UPI0024180727|nr:helix-turn-helix domain-containing protein [Hydrogenovibrio sp. 3SP14C1]MDG4811955.1 helix-turn-helix domain-containing protein [Hydrogenovibrio sp. 3SP14C1]
MTLQSDNSPANQALSAHVTTTLKNYFETLEGEVPSDVYQMVISQVERPLIEFVLNETAFNQSRSAEILGINRNTLRKKMQLYKIVQA